MRLPNRRFCVRLSSHQLSFVHPSSTQATLGMPLAQAVMRTAAVRPCAAQAPRGSSLLMKLRSTPASSFSSSRRQCPAAGRRAFTVNASAKSDEETQEAAESPATTGSEASRQRKPEVGPCMHAAMPISTDSCSLGRWQCRGSEREICHGRSRGKSRRLHPPLRRGRLVVQRRILLCQVLLVASSYMSTPWHMPSCFLMSRLSPNARRRHQCSLDAQPSLSFLQEAFFTRSLTSRLGPPWWCGHA